ncbi:MAG: hypothetical protein GWP10_04200 [Nitrospiraceae bacterium]|nr:hypothetical protein [Nitrospiraceae bacterium]
MSGTYFFYITILFLLWLFTCGAFILLLKRHVFSAKPSLFHSDLLIGLASEKYREAVDASKRLQEVADALHIGLVDIKAGQIKEMNQTALDLLPENGGHRQTLTKILTLLEEDSPKVVELDETTVQLKRLSISGSQDLVLIQDVTESFLMARRLKQQEKLALLGQMTAQMAHQIKTPIAIIAGQAQMLARHLGRDTGLKTQVETIYQEARDLARQINEILNFYRKREPYFSNIDLYQILHEVKRRLDSLGHSCKIDIECPKKIILETDPELLEKILFLFGQNAFSEETGATVFSITAVLDKNRVSIRIEDNGIGIPKSMRDKVFEPFVSTKGEGLGLGLFLARDLTRQMGGSLELEETEQGTSFRLSFPLRRAQ